MIARVWHGWTTYADAAAYERLLRTNVFPGIAARRVAGYRGISLLRREGDGYVEFVTIMRFDSLDAVRQFAGGDDYATAYVPEEARALLLRWDERSAHFDERERLEIA